MEMARRNLAAVLGVCAVLAGLQARADEPKVAVLAEVILLSNEGDTIDPPRLATLKKELERAGAKFTSVKRLSDQKVSVEQNKPAEVKLPDGRAASLKMVGMKDGVASVSVTVPSQKDAKKPLVETTYQTGRSSLTVPAGDYANGKLVLLLSPPEGAKPRRIPSNLSRPVLQQRPRAPALMPID